MRKLALLFLALGVATGAVAADHKIDIGIMTQNMDAATDQTFIVAAAMNLAPGLTIPGAVDLTYLEIQASHLPERARALARQIADRKPEILALQEATLWRTGPDVDHATTVVHDQLADLVSALKDLDVPYDVVAVNATSDLAAPGEAIPALRLTDRDALLVRADLRPPSFSLSDVHARIFDAAFPFEALGVEAKAGWIAAIVHSGNRKFRVVTTHLTSPIKGVDEATLVQVAQTKELLHELRNSTLPVVICGDFNSDALEGGGLDTTPSYALINAGYPEVWPAFHTGDDQGLTWPLYLEDQFPPAPFFGASTPTERIDLFFAQGMQALSIERVLSPIADAVPPFGSDHAGVFAVFHP